MMTSSQTVSVVTLGETMLRLTPPHWQRWSQAQQAELHVGGSESNVAVGLARLGHRVEWVSRLTDNPLGRIITSQLAAHGVGVGRVVWTQEDRVGVYFYEQAAPPRGSQVVYDRRGSAASRIRPEELPADLFEPGEPQRWLHTSGIMLGIGPSAAQTASAAIMAARQAGWKISLDVNYRRGLWSTEEAARSLAEVLPLLDLLIVTQDDAQLVLGADPAATAQDQLLAVADQTSAAVTAMTLGPHGAIGCEAGSVVQQPSCPVTLIGRLGAGDAFAAGFLHQQLLGGSLAERLAWGSAMAALKFTVPGDMPLIEPREAARLAQRLLQQPGDAGRLEVDR
jgi:2-dehydro-3-deoxygluconokinase